MTAIDHTSLVLRVPATVAQFVADLYREVERNGYATFAWEDFSHSDDCCEAEDWSRTIERLARGRFAIQGWDTSTAVVPLRGPQPRKLRHDLLVQRDEAEIGLFRQQADRAWRTGQGAFLVTAASWRHTKRCCRAEPILVTAANCAPPASRTYVWHGGEVHIWWPLPVPQVPPTVDNVPIAEGQP